MANLSDDARSRDYGRASRSIGTRLLSPRRPCICARPTRAGLYYYPPESASFPGSRGVDTATTLARLPRSTLSHPGIFTAHWLEACRRDITAPCTNAPVRRYSILGRFSRLDLPSPRCPWPGSRSGRSFLGGQHPTADTCFLFSVNGDVFAR